MWYKLIEEESKKPYYIKLREFLRNENEYGEYKIYPKSEEIFSAFKLTPFDAVKAVILGQDPYHGENQAHGLSFSVKRGIPPPPSLINILKELYADCGIKPANNSGDLTNWAKNGVLLLNTVLTVRQGQPTSHRGQGWETFTDTVISTLSQKGNIVFILWGADAKRKAQLINANNNLILTGSHPSPLSANKGGFFGRRYFTETNAFLKRRGMEEIDWRL